MKPRAVKKPKWQAEKVATAAQIIMESGRMDVSENA